MRQPDSEDPHVGGSGGIREDWPCDAEHEVSEVQFCKGTYMKGTLLKPLPTGPFNRS